MSAQAYTVRPHCAAFMDISLGAASAAQALGLNKRREDGLAKATEWLGPAIGAAAGWPRVSQFCRRNSDLKTSYNTHFHQLTRSHTSH